VTPTATHGLSLQRTESGWGLRDARDEAVFAADGRDARRKCVARAAELGILHLRFDEQPRPLSSASGTSIVTKS
jgi:hypothetical protein